MTKKWLQLMSIESVVGIVLLAVAIVVFFITRSASALLVLMVISVAFLMYSCFKRWHYVSVAQKVLEECEESVKKYTNAILTPAAVVSEDGTICWHNPAFYKLAKKPCDSRNIYNVFPELKIPGKDMRVMIDGRSFLRERQYVMLKKKRYMLYRLLDEQMSFPVAELYKTTMPTVAHVVIDNYSDLLRVIPQVEQSEMTAEIERLILKEANRLQAFYQKYERNKYIIIFERKKMTELEQNRFEILQEVKAIKMAEHRMKPTLSIGVGEGETPADTNNAAVRALELALGRGGDQAVIKSKDGFRFFGGIQQQSVEKRSRVKTRTFANALRNLMAQCDKVFIMGHTMPDLDCMGSALGLIACARNQGDKAYIVLDTPNKSIQPLLDEMRKDKTYKNIFLTPQEVGNQMDEQTMLIVVDTQMKNFTIAPWLVDKANTVVVIDHHIRGAEHIVNPTLFLHETFASSTAEMVTEIIQYFDENVDLRPLECQALLAGMMIDTKGFSFNTGVRTFEAASYLRRMGADTVTVRNLFQDDLDTVQARAQVVQSAQMYKDGIAIATCPEHFKDASLLAAQAADTLMNIKGVKASFVVCWLEEGVGISGRSLGTVNVQRILEILGGGGHATSAGAQLKEDTPQSAVEKLKQAIEQYEKEIKR